MKKKALLWLPCWALTLMVQAATLQDWSVLEMGKNAGVFADNVGSTIKTGQVGGPRDREMAAQLDCDIKGWAGIWVATRGDLSRAEAIRFTAKASVPLLLQVGFTDAEQNQSIASVRIFTDGWEEIVVPLSYFKRTPYPMPQAPRDGRLNWSRIVSVQFQPKTRGNSTLILGPLSQVSGKVEPRTGLPPLDPSRMVVQDFSFLERSAYGPFVDPDSGSAIDMELVPDPERKGELMGDFRYTLKTNGWCGYWVRAGEDWGGQDWTGAKALEIELYSQDPLELQFGFNDATQNAYTVFLPSTKGGRWETIKIPFEAVQHNKYYQPPGAKKGALMDLSLIEAFNLAPATHGTNEFSVRKVLVLK